MQRHDVHEPARIPALHDVRRTIEQAHQELRALFSSYVATDADGRAPLMDTILERLAAHLKWEEDFWYSRLQETGERGAGFVDAAFREHDEMNSMIQHIEQAESDDDEALDQYFQDLMQTAAVHFLREERALHESA